MCFELRRPSDALYRTNKRTMILFRRLPTGPTTDANLEALGAFSRPQCGEPNISSPLFRRATLTRRAFCLAMRFFFAGDANRYATVSRQRFCLASASVSQVLFSWRRIVGHAFRGNQSHSQRNREPLGPSENPWSALKLSDCPRMGTPTRYLFYMGMGKLRLHAKQKVTTNGILLISSAMSSQD